MAECRFMSQYFALSGRCEPLPFDQSLYVETEFSSFYEKESNGHFLRITKDPAWSKTLWAKENEVVMVKCSMSMHTGKDIVKMSDMSAIEKPMGFLKAYYSLFDGVDNQSLTGEAIFYSRVPAYEATRKVADRWKLEEVFKHIYGYKTNGVKVSFAPYNMEGKKHLILLSVDSKNDGGILSVEQFTKETLRMLNALNVVE